MITNAPLPNWSDIWRASMRRVSPSDKAELALLWCSTGSVGGWLSRSAWSLALVAIWRQRLTAVVPTIWIPDFFCNSSLLATRATGARLVFYPVDLQMLPDMPACRRLADVNPPDIFLLAHYFGRPAVAAPAREFCVRHGAWLVEDAAHVLRPSGNVGTGGDFVMYSPHKNISLPDGAVLVVRPDGPSSIGSEAIASLGSSASWAEQLVELSRDMGSSIADCRTHAYIWMAKRILQKLGFGGIRKSVVPFLELREPSTPDSLIGPSPSGLALRLMAVQASGLARVARLRQRRQFLWDYLFDKMSIEKNQKTLLEAERPTARSWIPYLASYRCETLDAAEIYDACRDIGLPALPWPDLAPEVIARPEIHVAALRLRHSRLYFPLHQSLSVTDMIALADSASNDQAVEKNLELVWDGASKDDWTKWLRHAGRSNLMQSWAYAAAKNEESGWNVRRGVFYRGQEVLAVVQVLQRSVFGVLRISRINRGPLFLGTANAGELRGVMSALGALGRIWNGRVLSIAPELQLSGQNISILEGLHFRQFKPESWESAWVDLNPEISALRKKLAGKWRTALVSAEKSELTCEVGTDDCLFDWMMGRYKELMLQKDFAGVPIKLLLALRKHQADEEKMVVFRASIGGAPIAGICVAPHGVCATYLIGWSGLEGRNLNATQYLLWRAMSYFKEADFHWFDLGGIDEESNSGVAAFKYGVNGARYETVGEYWNW